MASLQSVLQSIHHNVKLVQEAQEALEADSGLVENTRRAVRLVRRVGALVLDAEPYLQGGVHVWGALKEIDTTLTLLHHSLMDAGRKGALVLYLQADRVLAQFASTVAALDHSLGRLQAQCCDSGSAAFVGPHGGLRSNSASGPAHPPPHPQQQQQQQQQQGSQAVDLLASGSLAHSLPSSALSTALSSALAPAPSLSSASASDASACHSFATSSGLSTSSSAVPCACFPPSQRGSLSAGRPGWPCLPEETQEELAALRALLQRTRFDLPPEHAANLTRYRQACDSLQAPFQAMMAACAHMLRHTLGADLLSKESFYTAVAELQQEVEVLMLQEEAEAVAAAAHAAGTLPPPPGSSAWSAGPGPHVAGSSGGGAAPSPRQLLGSGAGGGAAAGAAGARREREARYLRMMMDAVRVHHVECDTPLEFLCPLTHRAMQDPVLLHETGHSYERKALEEWWAKGHHFCPRTGVHLRRLNTSPNQSLRTAIDRWRLHNDMQLSFRPVLASLVSAQQEERKLQQLWQQAQQKRQQGQQQQQQNDQELRGSSALAVRPVVTSVAAGPQGHAPAAALQGSCAPGQQPQVQGPGQAPALGGAAGAAGAAVAEVVLPGGAAGGAASDACCYAAPVSAGSTGSADGARGCAAGSPRVHTPQRCSSVWTEGSEEAAPGLAGGVDVRAAAEAVAAVAAAREAEAKAKAVGCGGAGAVIEGVGALAVG